MLQSELEALYARLSISSDQAQERYKKWREIDPYPDIPAALLNCADYLDYISTTGMLHPFKPNEQDLKTASCSFRLIGKVIFWDEAGNEHERILAENDKFTLEKDSIAFVTLEPFLRIPNYIALRFNLRIDHVYQGLLLGTGPLIDPGYWGKLSFPLHNLTTNDYDLFGGDAIIWVEFTKISPQQACLQGAGLRETAPGRVRQFYVTPKALEANTDDAPDVSFYLRKAAPHMKVRSSIPQAINDAKEAAENAKNRADDAERTVTALKESADKNFRIAVFSVGVAVIAMVLAIVISYTPIAAMLSAEDSYMRDSRKDLASLENRLGVMEKENTELHKQLQALTSEHKASGNVTLKPKQVPVSRQ